MRSTLVSVGRLLYFTKILAHSYLESRFDDANSESGKF